MKIYTLLGWVGLIVVAGYAMFHISYEVEQVENELRALNRQTLTEQEAIHVLEAEWSYLNSPDRLASLAERHLKLAPIPAERMIGFADLPYPGGGEEEEAPQPEAKLPPTLVAVPAALPGGQSQ